MNTPICDFVRRYADGEPLRLHMPGHKGTNRLGFEALDITEIDGADSLYEADGIIRQSERNASLLFGADTYYSTEGSSLSIRAMLMLAVRYAKANRKKPIIAAGRNAHKVFLFAAALLDFEVLWLPSNNGETYLSCRPSEQSLECFFKQCDTLPTALYLTSPDYLGTVADIESLAKVCHRYGVLLLVDNAHGAYLKFLSPSRHPIDQGADACCDSAHKTLAALTGAAYLHISKNAPTEFGKDVKGAMALFASTSPSYLILQSLDHLNSQLARDYPQKLGALIEYANQKKAALAALGFSFIGDEPIKWTVCAKTYGYTGVELAVILANQKIVCEFADPDYVVLMLTPEIGVEGIDRLFDALSKIEKKQPILQIAPPSTHGTVVLSIRNALLSPAEKLPCEQAIGRILASPGISCPPAVPILMPGERITEEAIEAFRYYGIKTCSVVLENK